MAKKEIAKWKTYTVSGKPVERFKIVIECEEEFIGEIMTQLADYGHIETIEKETIDNG